MEGRNLKCHVCGKPLEDCTRSVVHNPNARFDAAGIFECLCCDDCYEGDRYPYKRFDSELDEEEELAEYGESLYEEEF